MFNRNLDKMDVTNGERGIVSRIEEDSVYVVIGTGREVKVKKEIFTISTDGMCVAVRKQLPLKLAYATTGKLANAARIIFISFHKNYFNSENGLG